MIKRNILDCMTLVGGTPLRFEGEKTYVSTGAVDCDHVDYAQTERVTYDNRPSRANLSVAEGDILFAKMCGTKKTLRIDRPLSEHLYSTGFCAVRANESLIDAALLYHLLASDQFLTQKDQNSSGATQKAITNAGLRKIVIQVPDLPEQRKLAANLDCIEQMMANRREQLVSFDQLVKSRFIELFGDLASPDCKWETKKLVETCVAADDIKCGPFGTQLSKDEYVDSGVAVWEIPQINSLFATLPTHYLTEEKAKELDAYSIKAGDIAMSRKGNVGKCAVFPISFASGIIHSDVLRIRVDGSQVLPLFMMHQLHYSGSVQHQIELVSAGAIMAGINVTKLKQISVHIPPMRLQQQFVAFVEQTDKSKLAVQKGLQELEILKKSLMQQYFG